MASTLVILSPFIFLGLVGLIYGIIIYREYRISKSRISVNRKTLENNYLKIIVNSDLNELETQEEPELKRDVSEADENYIEVPKELVTYTFMLNPIRLAIMKTLKDAIKYPSADLRLKLGISWGKFTPHVNQLLKKGFIAAEDEFIENSPRKILILEEPGRQQFDALQRILKGLFN